MYLKSAGSFANAKESERDTLTCDENGFAQTKDMPYGTYTVHQVSGWEGRELMDDFDVFIAKDSQTYRYLINNANFESYIAKRSGVIADTLSQVKAEEEKSQRKESRNYEQRR